jgi:hypothetical protein
MPWLHKIFAAYDDYKQLRDRELHERDEAQRAVRDIFASTAHDDALEEAFEDDDPHEIELPHPKKKKKKKKKHKKHKKHHDAEPSKAELHEDEEL